MRKNIWGTHRIFRERRRGTRERERERGQFKAAGLDGCEFSWEKFPISPIFIFVLWDEITEDNVRRRKKEENLYNWWSNLFIIIYKYKCREIVWDPVLCCVVLCVEFAYIYICSSHLNLSLWILICIWWVFIDTHKTSDRYPTNSKTQIYAIPNDALCSLLPSAVAQR